MPSHEVIDLLSSDDDKVSAPPATLQVEKKAPLPLKGGFLDLGDESELGEIFSSTQLPKPKSTTLDASRQKKRSGGSEFDIFQTDDFGFAGSKRRKISNPKDKSDPIVFTSSPHGTLSASLLRKRILGSPFSSDSDLDEPVSDLHTSRPPLPKQLSDRTANLLADIIGNKKPELKRRPPGNKARSSDVRAGKDKARDDTPRSRSPSVAQSELPDKGSRATKARQTSAERNLKERERALKEKERELEKREREIERLRRATAKDDEKVKKRIEKQAKAKEKVTAAALAEVNRSSTDKKLSAKEMIVDLPSSVQGQKVDIQIRDFLRNYEVEVTTQDSVVPNVIKWRRKVARRFNEEMKHWEPAPPSVQPEKHVICLLSAKEFVALAAPKSTGDEDMEAHVAKLKITYTGCKLIYLIEGLDTLMRKAKNSKNRAYQAAVLSQMNPAGEAGSTAFTSRRKKAEEDLAVDEDKVEDALLHLQVMQDCLIHQTPTTVETAEAVCSFTMQLSTIPDKMQRAQLEAGFCIDVGQVKTGDDKDDTYIKMLQQIVRVTPAVASGVAAKYPDVVNLVKGMRKHGPCALEDLEKNANRNGAATSGRVGQALSRRLYKVFMSTDPTIGDI
ncbi:hypothetical protein MMC30_002686 [Trapelia coarctata]|nr:hypothetical protein [Trapelia coarctata]